MDPPTCHILQTIIIFREIFLRRQSARMNTRRQRIQDGKSQRVEEEEEEETEERESTEEERKKERREV